MKRVLVFAVGAVFAVLGVIALADATQNRPDEIDRNSSSRIVIHVRSRGFDTELAAQGLFAACHQTVEHMSVQGAGVTPVAGEDDTFAIVVRPSLGEHSRRRLQGCLEDGTIDRVWANVVAIESMSVAL
jgi:hypothetical protein